VLLAVLDGGGAAVGAVKVGGRREAWLRAARSAAFSTRN
jgi:hypothetical protein